MLYMPDTCHVEGVQCDLSGHAAPTGFSQRAILDLDKTLACPVSPFDGEQPSLWFSVCQDTSVRPAPSSPFGCVGQSATHPDYHGGSPGITPAWPRLTPCI